MIVIAALLLVVLGASVLGLRTTGGGPRWPFLAASTLSGGILLALVMATVIALTAGRDTWNDWVSGSQFSETVTLWLLLIVGPALLATCLALLIVGAVLRTRQPRRSGQASSR
jgi:heme/copper-type cytochrome/quinol oxidase subunit 2